MIKQTWEIDNNYGNKRYYMVKNINQDSEPIETMFIDACKYLYTSDGYVWYTSMYPTALGYAFDIYFMVVYDQTIPLPKDGFIEIDESEFNEAVKYKDKHSSEFKQWYNSKYND